MKDMTQSNIALLQAGDKDEKLAFLVFEELGLIDLDEHFAINRIVRSAARGCGFPMAAFSVSREGSQYYYAAEGLEIHHGQVVNTLCYRDPNNRESLFVGDTHDLPDSAVKANCLEHNIRSYYGKAVWNAQGKAIGTLALMDTEPRTSISNQCASMLHDLSRVIEDLNRAKRDSVHDSLTGLYNRRFLNALLQNEWNRGLRNRVPISLMLIDIDNFKGVNDEYGHAIGDEVIVHIADVAKTHFRRASDAVCRFGGDEFLVLLPNTDADTVSTLAERFREHICEDSGREAPWDQLTVSIGVASIELEHDMENTTAEAMLEKADAALLRSKRSGRNQVEQAQR